MVKKITAIFIFISFCFLVYPQDSAANTEDKYTVINYMITRVFQCSEGLVVDYIDNKQPKVIYIPNKFFREKKAFRFAENNTRVSPQMNIIFKNKKPEKIKLYLADDISSLVYRYTELVNKETYDRFQIDEIVIE